METLGGLFGGDENKSTTISGESPENDATTTDLQDQIRRLQKDVDYYKVESETFKKLLDECQDARSQ